jgi:osmotically-inducible protein OsmY
MDEAERICAAVRATLRSEPRIGPAHLGLHLEWRGGDLIIDGEVRDVAAKKRALERAAAVPGVSAIVDRLRVTPAERMPDDKIRDLVCAALQQDSAFANHAIAALDKGTFATVQAPDAPLGSIAVSVRDGVVTLDGDVPGLGQKRLAGVLAWWVPGSRDVVNGLGVTPPEADSDADVTDAVRVALEKDPFINADGIGVRTRQSVVTLDGVVRSEAQREMAEFDAWYVFGVDRVVNRLAVRP